MINLISIDSTVFRLKEVLQIGLCRAFLILLAVISLGISNSAYAYFYPLSATLNGAQSVSVAPGATISASLTVFINSGDTWGGTRFVTNPAAISTCQNTPDRSSATSSNTFNIVAPTTPGTYDATFIIYTGNSCTGTGTGSGSGLVNTITLSDAITVVSPDHIAPTVTSITRVTASPTNAASVQWTVTFNESVTGVDAPDFQLQNTGLSGSPAITSVTGSGSTYVVTASTGNANTEGTLGLDLIDNDSILDTANNRLGGTGAGNGSFTAGQDYTIVKPPTVISIARAGISPTSAPSVDWIVTFSESVKGVTPARFALVRTLLGGTPAITSVVDNGDGVTWTVTATTGTGSGTLGLNITAASGAGITDQTGNALIGLPKTGEVYTIDPTAPSECFLDSFARADGAPGADWAFGHESGTFGDPRIVNNRFRLTDASQNASTYATLQRIFPGAGNKIVVEFNHYAYGSNGADGMAMVLSDASKLPVAGAFGGSLGYAQKRLGVAGGDQTHDGFAGGWLGVALDEFGNFSNPTEGRTSGPGGNPGLHPDAVSIRGSGSGLNGYSYLWTSGTLAPGIDTTSSTPGPGYRYRITVDHSDSIHAYTKIERDTSGNGTNYTPLLTQFDVKAQTGQAAVPTNWSLSFTGSTGSNTNIHEFSRLQVCSVSLERLHHIELDHPANTCSAAPVTVKACANANCSSLYVGKVTVNLANVTSSGTSSWSSGNLLTFFNGQTQVTLSQGSPVNASVNIGGSIATSPPSADATVCKDGSNTTNCVVQFSSACSFDVVEPGKLPGSPIYTKLVGTSFTLDLRPGDASGNPSPYTGNVTVALIDQDAPPGAGKCTDLNAGITPESTFTFNNESLKTVPFNVNKAQKNVRVRVIAGSAGSALPSCSRDNFAIRPQSFQLTTPDMNDCGTSISCGSSYVAGNPFTVKATPTPTPTGYSGIPNFDKTKVQDHMGANLQASDALDGSFTAADSSGVASGTFRYDDVGSIVFLAGRIINNVYIPGAVNDEVFTNVDHITGSAGNVLHDSEGDCVPGSATNTKTLSGKYGCLIGNDQTMPKGRFRPHHYAVDASFTEACKPIAPAKPFTYMDQPMAIALAVRALSSQNVVLSRYAPTGNAATTQFLKLAAFTVDGKDDDINGDKTIRLSSLPPALPMLGLPAPVWMRGQYIASGSYKFVRETTPDGSFEKFKLGVGINDADGAKITILNGATKDPTTGADISTTQVSSAPTIIRFGRLKLLNANGSPQNILSVPMRVEYWSNTGFVTNTDDSCTVLQPSNVLLKNTASGSTLTINNISKGVGSIALSRANGKTSIDLCVDLAADTPPGTICNGSTSAANMPWLQGAWGGPKYDDDPTARATFGVFKSGPIIYLREVY